SRRRHTRSKRDWSSDVCSSDLTRLAQARLEALHGQLQAFRLGRLEHIVDGATLEGFHGVLVVGSDEHDLAAVADFARRFHAGLADRKSTRLNSSHVSISYAVFC